MIGIVQSGEMEMKCVDRASFGVGFGWSREASGASGPWIDVGNCGFLASGVGGERNSRYASCEIREGRVGYTTNDVLDVIR